MERLSHLVHLFIHYFTHTCVCCTKINLMPTKRLSSMLVTGNTVTKKDMVPDCQGLPLHCSEKFSFPFPNSVFTPVLEMESRASHMASKHSANELRPQPHFQILETRNVVLVFYIYYSWLGRLKTTYTYFNIIWPARSCHTKKSLDLNTYTSESDAANLANSCQKLARNSFIAYKNSLTGDSPYDLGESHNLYVWSSSAVNYRDGKTIMNERPNGLLQDQKWGDLSLPICMILGKSSLWLYLSCRNVTIYPFQTKVMKFM